MQMRPTQLFIDRAWEVITSTDRTFGRSKESFSRFFYELPEDLLQVFIFSIMNHPEWRRRWPNDPEMLWVEPWPKP